MFSIRSIAVPFDKRLFGHRQFFKQVRHWVLVVLHSGKIIGLSSSVSDTEPFLDRFAIRAILADVVAVDRCGSIFHCGIVGWGNKRCGDTVDCFEDEFVCNPDSISNDETPDFSYPPSQPQTSSFDQFHCFGCGDPLEDGVRCQRCTCKWCGYGIREGFCWVCASRDENSSIDAPNPNSFNDLPNDDMIESRNEILQSLGEMLRKREQAANISTHTPQPLRHFNSIYYDDDDDEESTIPLNKITSQIPPSIAITPVLLIKDSKDSLSIGDEHLSTIHENDCDLPSCDDFSPINIPEGNSMTFSNPLFYSNDDFTFSDNESLSDEDVLEDNVKIYLNPFFKFDDEYIFSDINPLFDEVLENIESKDSYVSNLDEPALLVTPLFDANEDEFFDPGGDFDKIDAFLDVDISMDIENGYHDSEGDIIYLESLLIDDTIPNLPPKVFLDHDSKNLKDKPDNKDLKSMVKVFDPGIWEKFFSPTYVRLPFEDLHYLSLTYVI
ncbi:hypothetical protein Tco_1041182 [Tanacetum coccineum]|uniref:Uncharacterized protein n=1 Tax=Tanacetum coccineum TaxID=301880 RepID=A0ABQ5GHP3_9ASTR